MRTIEESNLSFMIRCLARYEKYIKTSFVCREFCRNRLRGLDNPKMEYFTLYNEIVTESDAFMYLLDGILRISRNDTVNECAIYSTCFLEPCLEAFTKIPEVDILIDTLL